MTLSRGRGRMTIIDGRAFITARCLLCGKEHRYDKGDATGEAVAEIRNSGFSDEWLPCQADLPGNFWRVFIASGRQGMKPSSSRRGSASRIN